MPIMFSMVSRGIMVLAKLATCEGNFDAVTEYILAKIPLQNDALTYAQDSYRFHYIRENGITYLCITDDVFQRSRAFLFLLNIKTRFRGAYGNGVVTSLPYVIKEEFSLVLAKEMERYNTSNDIDTLTELDELEVIMARNVDNTSINGERVQLLVNIADGQRVGHSVGGITQEQARSMFRKSVMFWSFIVVMHVLLIYLLGTLICGMTWQECTSE